MSGRLEPLYTARLRCKQETREHINLLLEPVIYGQNHIYIVCRECGPNRLFVSWLQLTNVGSVADHVGQRHLVFATNVVSFLACLWSRPLSIVVRYT
jgi:hypothetical protein